MQWQQRWPEASEWFMSINLSGQELVHPDLVPTVDRILQSTGLSPSQLEFEITERSLIEHDRVALDVMNKFHARGMRLSIDDFGTGYSSLSYLHRFPFDILKIDRSFIQGIEDKPQRSEIVKAIIHLAHTLGMKVTAEGTETADSVECLKALHCEYVQGYVPAKPQQALELTRVFESEYDDARPQVENRMTRQTGSNKEE